jgi:hypothetical protein
MIWFFAHSILSEIKNLELLCFLSKINQVRPFHGISSVLSWYVRVSPPYTKWIDHLVLYVVQFTPLCEIYLHNTEYNYIGTNKCSEVDRMSVDLRINSYLMLWIINRQLMTLIISPIIQQWTTFYISNRNITSTDNFNRFFLNHRPSISGLEQISNIRMKVWKIGLHDYLNYHVRL